jgi:hypothetical protein
MLLAPLTGGAGEFRILRYEPVTISESVHPPGRASGGAVRGIALRFRVYGSDFAVDLEPNDRINAALSPRARTQTLAWRGTIAGRPGSWARVLRSHGRLTGMLFDGHELYSIESGAEARRYIRNPLAGLRDEQLVIYRLSDTLTDLEGDFCGVEMVPGVSSQADAFAALAAELQTDPTAMLVATKQLEVGVVADHLFAQAQGPEIESAVAARMNVVDGIFSSQVGVHLSVRSITSLDDDGAINATTVPGDLLTALGNYRRDSGVQQLTGLTHLMTGRNLDGNTVGIAYSSSGGSSPLCSSRNSASLSEVRNQTVNNSALIAAHEIGHNFGAPHDADANGACAAEAPGFLMAAQLNGSATFSPCSLTQMQPAVNTASCLASVAQSDAALVVPTSAPLALNQPTVVSFSVRSEGPGAIDNVQVIVALPPGVVVSGAGAIGGTCQIATSQVVCALASIPAGQSREIQMSLEGRIAGNSIARVTLTASGDARSDNNGAQIPLVTATGADISVSVSAASTAIETLATTVATILVRNQGGVAAPGTLLTATLPAGLVAVTVANNALGCGVPPGAATMSCSATTLAAGATEAVALTVRANAAGSQRLTLAVTSSLGDPDAANNAAGVTFTVTDPLVADTSVAVAAGSTTIETNSTTVATITVSNLSALAAPGRTLTATLPAGLTAVAVAANTLGCTVDGAGAFACTATSLAANSSQTVALTLRGTSAGARVLNVALAPLQFDPNTANNSAAATITVSDPVVVVATPAGGGGGGGRLGAELLLLGALLVLRLRCGRSALSRAA